MLYVESYGAGSHWRIARLFQERSAHQIDIIRLGRDHWRSLALAGHRSIAEAVRELPPSRYDLIVFSGPADVARTTSLLPEGWDEIPVITYFHESQWTYPAEGVDRLPHLISHLESIEASDAVLFNSGYHLDVFYESAWTHPSPIVKAVARCLLPAHWQKASVVSPPVHVGDRPQRRRDTLTVAWSARWEQDKRPDLMLDVARRLIHSGTTLRLRILGCDRDRWMAGTAPDSSLRNAIEARSGLLPREEYETALAESDVWLSTAEHEFFGVSAIEAAMLGAVPVVPDGLAYRETLPSAITYPPGDVDAAASRIRAISRSPRPRIGPWKHDAGRYSASQSVRRFDVAVHNVVISR